MTYRNDLRSRDVHSNSPPTGQNSLPTGQPLRRVAATGATGLLGRAVVAELVSRGVEVVAIARNALRARELLGDREGLHILVGDILATYSAPAPSNRRSMAPTPSSTQQHTSAGTTDPDSMRHYWSAQMSSPSVSSSAQQRTPTFRFSFTTAAPEPCDPHRPSNPRTRTRRRAKHRCATATTPVRCVPSGPTSRCEKFVRYMSRWWCPGGCGVPGDAGPTSSGQMFLSVANVVIAAVPRVSAHIVDARDVAAACVRAAQLGQERRYVIAGRRYELPAVCAQIALLCGVAVLRTITPRPALAGSGVVERADRLRHQSPLMTTRGTRVLVDMDRQWIGSARVQPS